MAVKRGLGKGLQALIPPALEVDINNGYQQILDLKVDQIRSNVFQPRRQFDNEKLAELAASIAEHGVVQPIVVRKVEGNQYQIVAGERRWRACKILKLDTIPAVIKDFNDQEMTEIALIENIQRQDLNPLEEAWAYKMLLEEFGLTQEQLSQRVGKSRPFIANMLRLLNLAEPVQGMLMEGQLSTGHARALLVLPENGQINLAKKIAAENLSVRETETLVKGINEFAKRKDSKEVQKKQGQQANLDPERIILLDLQDKLRTLLGTKVDITDKGEKGKITIEYYSKEDLTRIIDLLVETED